MRVSLNRSYTQADFELQRSSRRPILQRKAEHVKVGAGEELKETGQRIFTALQDPFYMLATEPVLLSISLYLSLLYALIYASVIYRFLYTPVFS